MNKLTKIANECQTDKGTNFNECHGYTEYYERWLSQYTKPKILEIGSWHGASTKMFNEYYNHECEIWTVDISYSEYTYPKQDNVHNFIVDQNNKEQWDKFFSHAPQEYDIVIDDGSHKPEHQMHTLFWLHKKLSKGGIYILEDLHTYMWDKLENSPLYFLNFWNDDNKYLTTEQRNELFENLEDIEVYHRKNTKTQYCGRSITSVLRFK